MPRRYGVGGDWLSDWSVFFFSGLGVWMDIWVGRRHKASQVGCIGGGNDAMRCMGTGTFDISLGIS